MGWTGAVIQGFKVAMNQPHPCLVAPGLWAERRSEAGRHGRPALFLDRDGVVVHDVHHLRRVEDVKLMEGIETFIAGAAAAGAAVIMVTNQSGIGRELFGWDDFEKVQDAIHAILASRGAGFDAVYACGYHEDATLPGLAIADHPWRKPNPGMLLAAAEEFGADLSRSWIVGDRSSDIEAGRRAGIAGGVLIGSEPLPESVADSYRRRTIPSLQQLTWADLA